MLFFAKKSLTKTGLCAGALSRGRNQLLVLHFSECFILTAFLMGRMTPNFIYLVIHSFAFRGNALSVQKDCKLCLQMPGTFWNYCVLLIISEIIVLYVF